MNVCIFSGRLTRDAELRYTDKGTPKVTFCIAVRRGFGEHETTEFVNCVMWNREKLVTHLTKGKAVMVRGEYSQRKYTNQKGEQQTWTEIIVDRLDFQQGGPLGPGEARQAALDQWADNNLPLPDGSALDDVPF